MRVSIKNGTVVNADGQAKQDLLIESGIVRQLGNNISPQLPYEEIDATGCYVFPGGVDVHTHFNIDVLKEGFENDALKVLEKGKKVALYCRSGNRSKNAARILSDKGFQVVELSTGFKGWKAAGKPSEVTE